MDNFDVHFLDAVGKAMVRHGNANIRHASQLAPIFSAKGNYLHAPFPGRFRGPEHIGRVAAGADRQQDVPTLSQGLYIA